MFIITEASRINTNLFVLQCDSFCCLSINSVSADFTSDGCSDARLHLKTEFRFTEGVIAVGGADLSNSIINQLLIYLLY